MSRFRAPCRTLFALLLAGAAGAADLVLVDDTFAGPAGPLAAARAPESGAGSWLLTGRDAVEIGDDGSLVVRKAGGLPGDASLTIACPSAPPVLAVEARIRPGSQGWIGLGLGGGALGEWFTPERGAGVFVMLHPRGSIGLFARQSSAPLIKEGSVLIPGFARPAFTVLRLEYRADPAAVRVLGNGAEVVPWTPLPAGYRPAVERAGVHFEDSDGAVDAIRVLAVE